MRARPAGIELERLNNGEVRKKKKKQEKTAEQTEEERWAEQMQKGGLVRRSAPSGQGEQSSGAGGDVDEDDDDDDSDGSQGDKSKAAAPRLVKQNNFQGETGTVDVDKHMMSYIEEEMQKRRQRGEIASLPSDVNLAKAVLNPEDELYSIAEKYRKIQQSAQEALDAAKRNVNSGHAEREDMEKEEGNATLSSAMLTGVPEIDLGMDHRMKNIQETEKAKRAMLEAQKNKAKDGREQDEDDFASARCELGVCVILQVRYTDTGTHSLQVRQQDSVGCRHHAKRCRNRRQLQTPIGAQAPDGHRRCRAGALQEEATQSAQAMSQDMR